MHITFKQETACHSG